MQSVSGKENQWKTLNCLQYLKDCQVEKDEYYS